jgi:hypothetical protein
MVIHKPVTYWVEYLHRTEVPDSYFMPFAGMFGVLLKIVLDDHMAKETLKFMASHFVPDKDV